MYADVVPRPNLIERSHRLAGGTQTYTNQYGSGYRCADCATKWLRRSNGQEVATRGPSRHRMGGWHPSMPVTGVTPKPPPLAQYFTIAQIADYNDERIRNNLEVVAADGMQWGPGAQGVDGKPPQPAA